MLHLIFSRLLLCHWYQTLAGDLILALLPDYFSDAFFFL